MFNGKSSSRLIIHEIWMYNSHTFRAAKALTLSPLMAAVCGVRFLLCTSWNMSRASSIYFILVLAPAFSLSFFSSDSLYIRVGLCYTAGSSFTSSPQGSGQVERKTYITLPVSPSLNHSSVLLCVYCLLFPWPCCVRLMLQGAVANWPRKL